MVLLAAVSVLEAVAAAYGADPLRIAAPEWFRTARYVIATKDKTELREALERKYAIIAGWENRPVETWVLEREESGAPLRGAEFRMGTRTVGTRGSIRGTASMEGVASALRHALEADVVDETGLGGFFELSISWTAGDADSMVRAFRDAGLELHREYREGKVLAIYSAYWPDEPKPSRFGCAAEPAVQSAIDAGEPERYPEDIFAGMAVQEGLRDRPDLALPVYARMADRTASRFLEARLFARTRPARARELLKEVLEEEPRFGQAYLVLAEAGGERAAALGRFRALCPRSLADAAMYDEVGDAELLRRAAEDLGRILATRIDDEALAVLPHYWRLRLRAGPASPPNWLALEVARVRRLDRDGDAVWRGTISAGERMLEKRRD